MQTDQRQLQDLVSIGPAMLRDLRVLGIASVSQLANQEPRLMYRKLCRRTGHDHDICVLDVFEAVVAQAKNPRLPAAQRQWWYWSRKRKARDGEK